MTGVESAPIVICLEAIDASVVLQLRAAFGVVVTFCAKFADYVAFTFVGVMIQRLTTSTIDNFVVVKDLTMTSTQVKRSKFDTCDTYIGRSVLCYYIIEGATVGSLRLIYAVHM